MISTHVDTTSLSTPVDLNVIDRDKVLSQSDGTVRHTLLLSVYHILLDPRHKHLTEDALSLMFDAGNVSNNPEQFYSIVCFSQNDSSCIDTAFVNE